MTLPLHPLAGQSVGYARISGLPYVFGPMLSEPRHT